MKYMYKILSIRFLLDICIKVFDISVYLVYKKINRYKFFNLFYYKNNGI